AAGPGTCSNTFQACNGNRSCSANGQCASGNCLGGGCCTSTTSPPCAPNYAGNYCDVSTGACGCSPTGCSDCGSTDGCGGGCDNCSNGIDATCCNHTCCQGESSCTGGPGC